MKQRFKWRRTLLLFLYLSDILSVILAFVGAYFLRNVGPFRMFLEEVQPIQVYMQALIFAVLLFLLTFRFFGLYNERKRIHAFSELYLVTRATTLWILFIMAGSYLYKYDYSRIIVVLTFLLTLLFANTGRALIRVIATRKYQNGMGLFRILIIGAGRPGRDLARRLKDYSSIGYHVVGFIDDKAASRKNYPVIGSIDQIGRIIEDEKIHEVYITDPTLAHSTILDIMARCPERDVRFKVVSNVFDLVSGVVDIARLDSIPSLDLWKTERNWWGGKPKRVFDIIIASVLLITTLPLWVLIFLVISMTDGMPVIFTQKRVGKNGKTFDMFKFRTMKKNTPRYADAPSSNKDERITPIGKLLRKTSLDELPQLLNILKGEMSMVGPRPEMPQKVAKYKRWQRRRLEIKPGLTGLWQILGRKDLPLEENIEYDFYYINNQTFLLDAMIIVKTIPIVLLGKGAY